MSNSNQKKQIRVSDILTNKEIEKWKDGSIITISAGTGVGKSYFIKNILFAYAKEENKKILMLIHRTNCVNQFKAEIKRDGKEKFIDIMTYQAIESRELNHNQINMEQYKYIVCDEFHYFIEDANFNKTTDISFDNILKQNHATRIFMSATGDTMLKYMKNITKIETVDYNIPLDFSFIDTLTFYNKEDTVESFANEVIKSNEKAIFFIQSAEKAYKLFKKYEQHAMFVCGKDSKYYKYIDSDKLDNMLITEKFDDLILITTSCLDAGVNILDSELVHIIIDIKDIGSLIQCMGRKRIQGKEKINVYIRTINNQQLGGLETIAKKNIEMADYLRKHNTKDYIEKYPRDYDRSNIVYDEYSNNNNYVKKVNELMYFKRKFDIFQYSMMKKWGKFGYCKYLAYKLGFYDEWSNNFTYTTIVEDNSLEKYLDEHIGKEMLQVSDRKELIEKINVRRNGKLIRKIETINPALEELGFQYQIKEFSTSRIINNKKKNFKSVWIVEKT